MIILKKYFSNLVDIKRICCIGAGYVGGPTMAVIAKNCPEIKVEVVDVNQERINAWNDNNLNNLPVFEPGLTDIVNKVRNKNLCFSSNVECAIEKADMVFISVNTPVKKKGIGAGQTSDLRWVESCARQICKSAMGHTIVVEKSTLPVKTAQTIKDILYSSNDNNLGFLISCYESNNSRIIFEGCFKSPCSETSNRFLKYIYY